MQDLESKVQNGQQELGKLIRQYFAVNNFTHLQFQAMAHAVMGVRWIHSAQISTLKREGGTKNLSGFPLYSIACVNKRLYEIIQGNEKVPPGTRKIDWEGKLPMLTAEGNPLTVGDMWMIYFGEIEAPLFSNKIEIELDAHLAKRLSKRIHDIYMDYCKDNSKEPMSFLQEALAMFIANPEGKKLFRGVLLDVIELDEYTAKEYASSIADFLSNLLNKDFNERMVYEMALDEG